MPSTRFYLLCSLVAFAALSLILVGGSLSAQDRSSYSAWQSTGRIDWIKYRWYTYGGGVVVPKCSYQLRNTDSEDHRHFDSTVYYTNSRGSSDSQDGPYLDKTYRENSGNVMNCTGILRIEMKVDLAKSSDEAK